jgi:glycosyltransferase involved in cell wall biosynthesis
MISQDVLSTEYLGQDKPVNAINPKVSVCVITYNHATFIAECLDNILKQETDFLFEIIIGEDNSTDGTSEICKAYAEKYPDKIRLFFRRPEQKIEVNGRKTFHFNFFEVLKTASGLFIALCEGDDYWTDSLKLQKQVEMLEHNTDCVVCHHWQKYAWLKDGKWVEEEAPTQNQGYLNKEKGTVKDIFENKLRVKTRTMMFRNIFKDVPFPEWFYKVAFGDVPLNYILGKYGDYYFIDEPMAVYRQTDTGVSKAGLSELGKRKFTVQHFKNWIDIWDFADKHYGYKYHAEAQQTVNEFYRKIVKNTNLNFRELTIIFKYHFFERHISVFRTWPNTKWLLMYYIKTVGSKVKTKMAIA